jgi:hypothetical protein
MKVGMKVGVKSGFSWDCCRALQTLQAMQSRGSVLLARRKRLA